MWTINYDDVTVSYDNEEIYTTSPGLEALILQRILDPPVLYATPTGPSEIFDLAQAHLSYSLTATILFETLGIKEWNVEGDYLWPLDDAPTGPDSTTYVDFLRSKRAEAFANDCHNPAGTGGGQFCSPSGAVVSMKSNSTLRKKLNKELDAQGVDEMSPLRGTINYPSNRIAISRDSDGNINGALTYSKDSTGTSLHHIRVLTDKKFAGIGTALMVEAAKDTLTIKDPKSREMSAHGTVQDAVPFHQKLGAVYHRERNNRMAEDENENSFSWHSTGEYSTEAVKNLAEGHPIDKRIGDPNQHDLFEPIYGWPKADNPYAGPEYDKSLKYYYEQQKKATASNRYVNYLRNRTETGEVNP